MVTNAAILTIGLAIFIIGIILLAIRNFRETLFSREGRIISGYIAKLFSSIIAIVGLIVGTNLIVEVQPIVEKYTNTMETKTNTQTLVRRDTIVILCRDTVFIPKKTLESERDSTSKGYIKRQQQTSYDFVKQQNKEVSDFIKQQNKEIDNYLKSK